MVEKVVQTFEELIRRSLAPSMTLFAFLALGDLVHAELRPNDSAWDQALTYANVTARASLGVPSIVFVTFVLLMVIGVSYALSALQQVLFDDRLKKNFDPILPVFSEHGSRASEAHALRELRDRVRWRLHEEPTLPRLNGVGEPSDYVLYEILGGIDPTSTRRFVDTAKSVGITCISMILVLVGNALYFFFLSPGQNWWALLLLAPAVGIYWLGKDATAAQYRARALRLYVNFLALPSEYIHHRLAEWGEKAPAAVAAQAKA